MAAFNHNGTTYFYAGGKWLDYQSKPVPAEIAAELDTAFSKNDKKQKEEKQQKLEKKKKTFSYAYTDYSSKNTRTKNKHKRAKVTSYKRTVALTADQKRALGVLESGENVFLSGEAGTGKSFVLNEYIYRNRDKNIIVCAPTGIAAINVGGSTLHRVFNVPISVTRPGDYNPKPDSAIVKADVIIIDEISMCRLDIFEYVIRTIHKAEQLQQSKAEIDAMSSGQMPELIKSKQIIVVGDFFQLAPVITSNDREIIETYWDMDRFADGFAFGSELWDELNFKNVVLKEIVRQQGDAEYIKNLNKIRKGDASGVQWFNEHTGRQPIPDSIYLCATNRAADTINERESIALAGKPETYTASIKGQVQMSDKMTQDVLSLKVGMQVMTLINDIEAGYQNGSIGQITSLGADSVEVRLNTGKYVTVKPHDWEILGYEVQEDKLEKIVLGNFKQLPLKIAYAITIHKSQGQTYASANISPDCFAEGQLYVALSRVQSIEGMSLEHDIRYNALRTSQEVKDFYENLVEIEEGYSINDVAETVEDVQEAEIVEDSVQEEEETKQIEVDVNFDNNLFSVLKALRLEIARQEGMPAYIIFPDKALLGMSITGPETNEEMLTINGVGKTKLEKYGQQFIDVIKAYKTEHPELTFEKVEDVDIDIKQEQTTINSKPKKRKYADWVKEYPDYVVIKREGAFFTVRNDSARIIGKITTFKVSEGEHPLTGSPVYDGMANALEDHDINYVVIEDDQVIEKQEFDNNQYRNYLK